MPFCSFYRGRGCTTKYPGIYSRTSYFYDWIAESVCQISEDPPEHFDCLTRTPTPTDIPTLSPSRAPSISLAPTKKPILEFLGWAPPKKVGLCQGNCNRDFDCKGDLVCFKRSTAIDIPGCLTTTFISPYANFCVEDKTQVEALKTSAPILPITEVPLTQDRSSPPTLSRPPTISGAPSVAPTLSFSPTTSGAPSLTPTQSQSPTISSAPSLNPTTSGAPSLAQTYSQPPIMLEASTVATTFAPTQPPSKTPALTSLLDVLQFINWDPIEPLQHCQGDCDRDVDCAGDMVCYKRSGLSSVPGCAESSEYIPSISHFCNYKNAIPTQEALNAPVNSMPEAPSMAPTIAPSNGPFLAPSRDVLKFVAWEPIEPLGHCQGDCDRDADCEGGMTCFKRVGSSSVPGCDDSSDYIPSIARFCV